LIPIDKLREQGSKPVRITAKGEMFIGDDEFPYPIMADSVSVARHGRHRNLLTLTLFVGEVVMEIKRPKAIPDEDELADDPAFVQCSSWPLAETFAATES
jgi:hypothetical protein